ncbi:sensor histidine kinase [Gracilibacillus orientalis]|nr:sensor histidine kinase [Gracilibacillus orientalis]
MNKILIKNIVLFLFPVLIPVFILGSFAIIITDKYMKESITTNNLNLLQQLDQQTSLVLNDMHLLHLDYNWNPEIILSLQNILDSEFLTLQQKRNLEYGEGTLRRKAIATPYIHSIYVYYMNDKDRVLTSRAGVTSISSMHDTEWFEEFDKSSKKEELWMRTRSISEFSFESPEPVISIYKNIFKTSAQHVEGIIVLNIYQSYFKDLMNELNHYQDQNIFVLDENHQKLYENTTSNSINPSELDLTNQQESYSMKLDGNTYIVHQLFSDEYQLRYISVIEDNIIYNIPNQLRWFTLLFVLLSLILGAATIYYLSQKNAKHVHKIISTLNTTSQHEEWTKKLSFKDNEYQLIVQRILKNYVNQSNLEKELKENKYQLQSAELLALQNQINPHFLSNTLTIIYWRAMALTGQPNKVTKMVETLTDILHFSLRIKQHTVTLAEEIHHTQNYIDIIKIRSDHPFSIIWDYDEKLLDKQVLKFMLQPIIENSLAHGIDHQSNQELTIKIKIHVLEDKIHVTMIDSGKGISKENLHALRREIQSESLSTKHIGLANTNKRLELIFNSRYTFIIRSKERWGTSITIVHPIKD